jgi:hypothetical protein
MYNKVLNAFMCLRLKNNGRFFQGCDETYGYRSVEKILSVDEKMLTPQGESGSTDFLFSQRTNVGSSRRTRLNGFLIFAATHRDLGEN